MARVTLRPEIAGISGKVGNMIFKTFKNGQVRVYKAPEYQRKTKPSENEMKARDLFEQRAQRVKQLMALGISKQEAWQRAKTEIH